MAATTAAPGGISTRTAARGAASTVRAAGIAGAAGLALIVVVGVLAGEGTAPWWTEPPAVVAAYYENARLDVAQALNVALQPIGYLLLTLFLVTLATVLAAADGGWRLAEITLAVAGGLAAVFGMARLAPPLVAAFRAGRGGLDPTDSVLLNDLDFALYWPTLSLGAAVLVAAGFAMLRTGLFARWLAWAALLLAPVVLVVAALPAADRPLLEVGVGLTWLWFVVVGIAMAVRPERYAAADRPSAERTPMLVPEAPQASVPGRGSGGQ